MHRGWVYKTRLWLESAQHTLPTLTTTKSPSPTTISMPAAPHSPSPTESELKRRLEDKRRKKAECEEKEREEAAALKAAEEDAARVAAAQKAAERKRKRAEPEDVIPR